MREITDFAMRLLLTMVLAIWGCGLFSHPAYADRRVALMLGNSKYQHVSRLANPSNDAALLAETFKKANFEIVMLRTDLTAVEMRRSLRDFADKARDADVAVIYYAGHGIEVDGTNYLIPTDAVLERDADVYDEALGLDRVLVAVEPARKLRLIILDACRDNPFAKTMKRTLAQRGIGQGLAKVEPANPNTMIAFAAKAGFTAADGDGSQNNSPFAIALAAHLTAPGLDLRKAFGYARDDVLKATNNHQEPFIYGSLGGEDVALVPAPAAAPPPPPAPALDPNEAIRRDYELAERVGTREAWDFFIATYPDGFYAKLAVAQRNKLAAEEARIAATEKARIAAEERARLQAEGAKAAAQAKAAADAKAAEDARILAEKKKAAEDANVVEAQRAQAAAQAKAKAEAEKAEAEKAEAEAQADARAKAAAQLAALTPADQAASKPPADDTPRLLLNELRRVGCFTGSIEGSWNDAAQRSIGLFNKYAGTTLDTKLASLDTLEVVRGKRDRVCPLICEHGYRADRDVCSKIICKAGLELDDDNECTKSRTSKPEAKHDSRPDQPQPANRAAVSRAPADDGGDAFLHKCGATSCSMALRGCTRKNAMLGMDNSRCVVKYDACLQTGSFVGRYCNLHGLARN